MKTPSLTALALAAVCSAASAEHFVNYDNPLIPTGLRPGDSFHLVFATSGTTNRDAGGGSDTFPISHWNTFVDNQAAASTVGAIQPTMAAVTWKAVVSTTAVAARDNALVSAPVYRIDGQLVATGFDDLWDGSVIIPVELTQNLTVVPGAQQNLVYTGSTSAGFPDNKYPLGNVTALHTGKFWDPELAELASRANAIKRANRTKGNKRKADQNLNLTPLTPEEQNLLKVAVSDADFHYMGSGKIMTAIGKGFAGSMLELGR